MSDHRLTYTSKFLSYVLRHHPESIGLDVDRRGWAEVEELIRKSREDGRPLTRELIEKIIEHGEKTRFRISDDGKYIRAGYGHSIDVDLGLDPVPPPEVLYHGTARSNASSIREEGLHPGSRNYVHLSADRSSARAVGSRHGKPYLFRVLARKMYEQGLPLYKSDSEPDIWLVEKVPARYIEPDSADMKPGNGE